LWGRDRVCAVDNLNLRVRYNEVFGLLGPNGSGKTTTIKMLLGLLHPTRGKAIVLGGDSSDPKISARIGFMPEESYLYRYLNARETLDFYGRLFGLPGEVRKTRTEALLEMVGLKAVANRPVGTYSKGMARRIGLAQALINDPDLLILDEPTTGLDPIGTRQIKDLILKLAERGKTILLCSHLLADVEDVCDRIAILYGGKIQAEGKVRELLQQTDKRQITTSLLSDEAIEQIRRIIEKERGECEVTTPMDKLETFFIKTVTAAQEKAVTTTGAVSTTAIGDFLAQEMAGQGERSERILEKLVSAPVSPEAEPAEPETTSTTPVAPGQSRADEKLLEELTETTQTSEPTAAETEPVTEQLQVDADEKVRKDILDQLARGGGEEEQQREKPESGDSTDG